MEKLSTVTELIGLWPSRRELAEDVGVMTDRVHKWAQANAIPARFHQRILESAKSREFAVSAELLVRLHNAPDDPKNEDVNTPGSPGPAHGPCDGGPAGSPPARRARHIST